MQTKEFREFLDSPGDAFRDDSKYDGDDKPGLSIRLGKDFFLTKKWPNISIFSVNRNN